MPATVRDQFAMAALPAIFTHDEPMEVEGIAQKAYAIADAMMEERKRRDAPESEDRGLAACVCGATENLYAHREGLRCLRCCDGPDKVAGTRV